MRSCRLHAVKGASYAVAVQNTYNFINWNTPFAPSPPVSLVKAVSEPGPENTAFRPPAHHVTSPERLEEKRNVHVYRKTRANQIFTFFMRQIAQKG